jgi:hypothetical protein
MMVNERLRNSWEASRTKTRGGDVNACSLATMTINPVYLRLRPPTEAAYGVRASTTTVAAPMTTTIARTDQSIRGTRLRSTKQKSPARTRGALDGLTGGEGLGGPKGAVRSTNLRDQFSFPTDGGFYFRMTYPWFPAQARTPSPASQPDACLSESSPFT